MLGKMRRERKEHPGLGGQIKVEDTPTIRKRKEMDLGAGQVMGQT